MKPWDRYPDRTQQLMTQFQKFTIFYFYPSGQTHSGRTKVGEKVYAYPLPKDYPQHTEGVLARLRWKKLAKFVSRTMSKHRVRTPLLWLTHPIQREATDFLSYSQLIYDCCQLHEQSLRVSQEMLVSKADLVFASSKVFKTALAQCNKNIVILPNGVDFQLFNNIQMLNHGVSENVFGYVGKIHEDLDLSPLLYAAVACPQWEFLLVGTNDWRNQELPSLRHLENVHFLEEQEDFRTIELLLSCRVLLDFRTFTAVPEGISTRILEYLSSGRPIVTHLWENEVETYEGVMYGAFSEEEFLEQCELALEEKTTTLKMRRKGFGKKADWRKRVDFIESLFQSLGYI